MLSEQSDTEHHMSKDTILKAALALAPTHGIAALKRETIAKRLKVSTGTISYHFDGMDNLRAAVVAKAVEDANTAVVARALAERHPGVRNAPQALRLRAARLIAA